MFTGNVGGFNMSKIVVTKANKLPTPIDIPLDKLEFGKVYHGKMLGGYAGELWARYDIGVMCLDKPGTWFRTCMPNWILINAVEVDINISYSTL